MPRNSYKIQIQMCSPSLDKLLHMTMRKADNRRVSMTDVTGTTYFEYDCANRLIAMHSPGGSVVRYEYDLIL